MAISQKRKESIRNGILLIVGISVASMIVGPIGLMCLPGLFILGGPLGLYLIAAGLFGFDDEA
jgi:hypothetical protein